MKWLDKLERRFGKYYIPNLMLTVIGLSAVAYIITFYILGDVNYISKLKLYPPAVMSGEVWRLITFVIIPPTSGNIIMVALGLYFTYIAGVSLENEWGEFKFNVYFFFGMLSTIILSFITGSEATGSFVTLSIFLAFAKLYPNYTILLFFILPVKMKWLGYLAWAGIVLDAVSSLINRNIGGAILSLIPILNYVAFFGKNNYRNSKMKAGSVIRISDYKKNIKSAQKPYRHKCTVCGITDLDDKNMSFRYCSRCNGHYGYCEKHILNHEHIK